MFCSYHVYNCKYKGRKDTYTFIDFVESSLKTKFLQFLEYIVIIQFLYKAPFSGVFIQPSNL